MSALPVSPIPSCQPGTKNLYPFIDFHTRTTRRLFPASTLRRMRKLAKDAQKSAVALAIFRFLLDQHDQPDRHARREAMDMIGSLRPDVVKLATSMWAPWTRAVAQGRAAEVVERGSGFLMREPAFFAGHGKRGICKLEAK